MFWVTDACESIEFLLKNEKYYFKSVDVRITDFLSIDIFIKKYSHDVAGIHGVFL